MGWGLSYNYLLPTLRWNKIIDFILFFSVTYFHVRCPYGEPSLATVAQGQSGEQGGWNVLLVFQYILGQLQTLSAINIFNIKPMAELILLIFVSLIFVWHFCTEFLQWFFKIYLIHLLIRIYFYIEIFMLYFVGVSADMTHVVSQPQRLQFDIKKLCTFFQ